MGQTAGFAAGSWIVRQAARVLSFNNGSHSKGEHHGIRNRCTGSRDSRYRHIETDLRTWRIIRGEAKIRLTDSPTISSPAREAGGAS
jgi:hypothetical protein